MLVLVNHHRRPSSRSTCQSQISERLMQFKSKMCPIESPQCPLHETETLALIRSSRLSIFRISGVPLFSVISRDWISKTNLARIVANLSLINQKQRPLWSRSTQSAIAPAPWLYWSTQTASLTIQWGPCWSPCSVLHWWTWCKRPMSALRCLKIVSTRSAASRLIRFCCSITRLRERKKWLKSVKIWPISEVRGRNAQW